MISRQLVPHGGWKYREARTNTTIVGRTFDDLVKWVREHRKSNGITPGNVELDVEEQIEANHPEIVINKAK